MTWPSKHYVLAGACLLGAQLALACVETTPAVPAPPVVASTGGGASSGVGSSPPLPVTSDISPAATAARASSGAPDAVLEHTFERTKPLAPAACVLVGEPWLPHDEEVMLTLRPGGPSFVHVAMTAAQIEIPNGEASAVFVRMDDEGWNVAGHLAAEAFTLWPLQVVTHDGFLITTGLSDLQLVRAQPGQLWLTLNPPHIVRRAAEPVPKVYTCQEVNVGPPPLLDEEAALPGDPATRRGMKLRPRVIPLSTEPGAAPVAWIDAGADQKVIELERRAGFGRIALLGYTTLAFGWVAQQELSALPPAGEEVSGFGGLGGAFATGLAQRSARPGRVRCEAELPVLVRIGTEVIQVGSVEANTWLEATQLSETWAELRPPRDLKLAPGASFVTPRAGFSRCKPELVSGASKP